MKIDAAATTVANNIIYPLPSTAMVAFKCLRIRGQKIFNYCCPPLSRLLRLYFCINILYWTADSFRASDTIIRLYFHYKFSRFRPPKITNIAIDIVLLLYIYIHTHMNRFTVVINSHVNSYSVLSVKLQGKRGFSTHFFRTDSRPVFLRLFIDHSPMSITFIQCMHLYISSMS